jgi:hypothetical protein
MGRAGGSDAVGGLELLLDGALAAGGHVCVGRRRLGVATCFRAASQKIDDCQLLLSPPEGQSYKTFKAVNYEFS